jgi:hypothetical protein
MGVKLMENLLTKQDLADRWQVTVRCIENWMKDGIIVPVKGIPTPRFNPAHIAELEGVKMEKFSPLERRKLERELEEAVQERDFLKGVLANILAESSKVVKLIG